MKLTFRILLFLTFLSFFGGLQAQDYSRYYTLDEMPDAGVFLPAPPAFADPLFANDFYKWQWGKSQRDTERGIMASLDSEKNERRMAEIYGEVMDMEITKEGTPAIWKLISRTSATARYTVVKAKKKYMRIRPFVKMNEHVASKYDDEERLSSNGSYPSGHTAYGWSVALALAEMAPEYQDALLRRGYQYGESRVIVGAHWQSDVDASLMAMAAAMARLHTSDEYIKDLEEARNEFAKIKSLPKKTGMTSYPNGENIIDPVGDIDDFNYYADVVTFWEAEKLRDTERGKQALIDADSSLEGVLSCFSPYVGITLSENETPAIAELVATAGDTFLNESSRMKAKGFRTRPYVQLGEPTMVPDDEEAAKNTSSFPSSSAALGWGIALILTEIAPAHQNELMRRGYEYGYSRVIVGYHYSSDVLAGRLMATYVYTQMHNDPAFAKLMAKAKKEYSKKTK